MKSRSPQRFFCVQNREAISLIFFSLELINQSYYKPTKLLCTCMYSMYVCSCLCLCIHVYTVEHTQSSPAAVLLSFHLSQQIHVSAPGNSQLSSLNSQVSSLKCPQSRSFYRKSTSQSTLKAGPNENTAQSLCNFKKKLQIMYNFVL